jgi:single-strand DNA-binding protein
MNHIVISGHLVDKVRVGNTQDGRTSAFGKIGVYNGKNRDGQQRDSMFFDISAFGRSAELLRDNTDKGSPVTVSGRLEEDKSVSQTNGQTYVNKRIICDDVVISVKPTQNVQQVPVQNVPTYQQIPVQPTQNSQAPSYGYTTGTTMPYGNMDPFAQ